ncbi:hypothetical protein EON83_23030 [bacterium]|nr:MAG: hypothetical protein EON83_23030 [bacterium]
MKLRIRNNSLRFRLDQKDMEALLHDGQVESHTQFAPGIQLLICVARCHQTPLLAATCEAQKITLYVRDDDALEWMQNTETGFSTMQSTGEGNLRLLLEKDYPCLVEREGESDEHAFAWPEEAGIKAHAC